MSASMPVENRACLLHLSLQAVGSVVWEDSAPVHALVHVHVYVHVHVHVYGD